ncbi:MAG: amylo-alpha-1,6-glucosidase, partial [Bacteroidota bacterium]
TDDGKSVWFDSSFATMSFVDSATKHTRAVSAFEYEKQLNPNDEMTVVLVIGSSANGEVKERLATLSQVWRDEIAAYDDFVRNYAVDETRFTTGDLQLDQTVLWSKGILAANAHYLNGKIVPMPCPAEYNFFFTHDLLMTNLGAVLYDIKRVKKDLMYVALLARDSIIPHAYYWKDDGFKTEFCTPSNWNHLWFIEVSARYFRHSLDTTTLRVLYPLIVKSLAEMKKQLRHDNLMYAHRPDWWDIGWNEGPRTYMTALAIRQIENYLYIASIVDKQNRSLKDLEQTAARMRTALVTKLWNDSLKFLLNYNGNDLDTHQYMGSLLAPAVHVIDEKRSSELIETARKELLAPRVGIRAAVPADFHTDSMISYFKFFGKEAGDAYTYINGGVWFHNNAWYALALHSIGRLDEAMEFVKQTMTIDGIARSPNGVPAMYEYRYSNQSSTRFGEIDKPSFLWAGGFYLYTLYTLVGMNENVWNLSFSEYTATFPSSVEMSYSFSDVKNVQIDGTGRRVHSIVYDGVTVPSLVIPIEQHTAQNISAVKGNASSPYLKSVNAMLHSVKMNGKKFTAIVSSFNNHSTVVEFVSLQKPKRASVNTKNHAEMTTTKRNDGAWTSMISFTAGEGYDTLTVEW